MVFMAEVESERQRRIGHGTGAIGGRCWRRDYRQLVPVVICFLFGAYCCMKTSARCCLAP